MSQRTPDAEANSVSGSVNGQAQQVRDRFEAAWKAAASQTSRPHIQDFLSIVPEPERSTVFCSLLAMELNYATRIAEGAPEAVGQWRPVAAALSSIFRPLGTSSEALIVLHGIFFWVHLTLVFGFLVYLGYSKHLHIITAVFNVFFKDQYFPTDARTGVLTPYGVSPDQSRPASANAPMPKSAASQGCPRN